MNIFTFGDDHKVNFNPQQPMNLKENLKFEKKLMYTYMLACKSTKYSVKILCNVSLQCKVILVPRTKHLSLDM